jgi:hypothetical protein
MKPLCLLLAAAALAAGTFAVCAPAPLPKEALPAEELARPAIDPARLADSPALRALDARLRAASAKNLERIALAVVEGYTVNHSGVLPEDVRDKDDKALLSWRVLLLPYLGEKALFKQFNLDQPWDSKHNLRLLEKMPRAFESPRVAVKRKGYTVYQIFWGRGALFGPDVRPGLGSIPGGLNNAILAVESSTAVPWTKPADIPFDSRKPLPPFGKAYGERPLAALCDGSVRVLDLRKILPATLRLAINPQVGKPLGPDWED